MVRPIHLFRILTACMLLLLVAGWHLGPDGRRWVRYFLVEPAGKLPAGEQVSVCPHCGHPLPRLTWTEFEARMPEAYGA